MVMLNEALNHLQKEIGKPVLIMLDDVHYLIQSEDYQALASTMRALLDSRPEAFSLVMTADNMATFRTMTQQRGAPMAGFGRVHPYKCDTREFCEHVRSRIADLRQRVGADAGQVAQLPTTEELVDAFEQLGNSYNHLWEYATAIAQYPQADRSSLLFDVMTREREARDASHFFASHPPLQQLILQRLAEGRSASDAEALKS